MRRVGIGVGGGSIGGSMGGSMGGAASCTCQTSSTGCAISPYADVVSVGADRVERLDTGSNIGARKNPDGI